MSSISRKLKRNKKNPMVDIYVETVMKSLISDKEQDITLCSYNRNFFKNGQELLIKFNIHFIELIFSLIAEGKEVYTYSDFFSNCIKNNNSTMLFNYTVENDRVLYKNKLVGFNAGKLLVDDYIVYFAGPNLFFEDTKTSKKYIYSRELIEKEVA